MQTILLTLPFCVSYPPSTADESDGGVNCMQLGDWLQRLEGESGVPTSESLFHKNYYALYFVLNIHRVPYGTLKVIWQHFGAKQHAHTHTHAVVEHTQWDKSTHTSMSNSEHMCTNMHRGLLACGKKCNHVHTLIHLLIFLSSLLFVLIYSFLLFSEYKYEPSRQPPPPPPPTQSKRETWSKYLMEKRGVSEYFIKYLWGMHSWVTVADNCEPWVWKSALLSIMHQPSKEKLPRVPVLWDSEYLKL